MNRRGFILPVVLLLLLAISGLATVALAVARNEVFLEPGDFRYLRERVRWETALEAFLAGTEPWEEGEELLRRPLAGGYVLVRGGTEAKPAHQAVAWLLDPASVAAALPPAAEVGWGVGDPGVVAGEGECAPLPGEPLVRVRPSDRLPLPDPSLEPPPRLGPVGLVVLLGRAGVRLGPGDPLPGGSGPLLVEAPPDGRLVAGEGGGMLLGAGTVTLGGDVRWRGIVLAERDLVLEEGASLEGVALVGGRLRVRDDARLVGCPALAAWALRASGLDRPFFLPGGGLLGRF